MACVPCDNAKTLWEVLQRLAGAVNPILLKLNELLTLEGPVVGARLASCQHKCWKSKLSKEVTIHKWPSVAHYEAFLALNDALQADFGHKITLVDYNKFETPYICATGACMFTRSRFSVVMRFLPVGILCDGTLIDLIPAGWKAEPAEDADPAAEADPVPKPLPKMHRAKWQLLLAVLDAVMLGKRVQAVVDQLQAILASDDFRCAENADMCSDVECEWCVSTEVLRVTIESLETMLHTTVGPVIVPNSDHKKAFGPVMQAIARALESMPGTPGDAPGDAPVINLDYKVFEEVTTEAKLARVAGTLLEPLFVLAATVKAWLDAHAVPLQRLVYACRVK